MSDPPGPCAPEPLFSAPTTMRGQQTLGEPVLDPDVAMVPPHLRGAISPDQWRELCK